MKAILPLLAFAALIGTAMAQVPVRPATPDEAKSAEGARLFAEQHAFVRTLFGNFTLPKGCRIEVVDPSRQFERTNLRLICGPLTYCDSPGVVCE